MDYKDYYNIEDLDNTQQEKILNGKKLKDLTDKDKFDIINCFINDIVEKEFTLLNDNLIRFFDTYININKCFIFEQCPPTDDGEFLHFNLELTSEDYSKVLTYKIRKPGFLRTKKVSDLNPYLNSNLFSKDSYSTLN